MLTRDGVTFHAGVWWLLQSVLSMILDHSEVFFVLGGRENLANKEIYKGDSTGLINCRSAHREKSNKVKDADTVICKEY